MKKSFLLSAIAISGFLYNTANAQLSVHLGLHLFPHRVIVTPRIDVDAPVYADADYNSDDDYYYLPDVNAYYNVTEQCYYYFDGDNWVSAAYLPGEYHDYDWRNSRRFEVREARPYLHNDVYMNRYRGARVDFARYRDQNFRGGFNNHNNRYAYNNPQHFDDRHNDNHFGFDGDRNRNDNHNKQPQQNQGWNRGNDHGNQQQQPQQNQGDNRGNNQGNQQQPQQNQGNNRGNNHGQQTGQQQDHNNDNRGGQQQQVAQNNAGGHGGGRWNRF